MALQAAASRLGRCPAPLRQRGGHASCTAGVPVQGQWQARAQSRGIGCEALPGGLEARRGWRPGRAGTSPTKVRLAVRQAGPAAQQEHRADAGSVAQQEVPRAGACVQQVKHD